MAELDLLEHMSYESLTQLREVNPAWRLLASSNATFVASFLYEEFLSGNKREMPEYILISHLESHMEKVANINENDKSAQEYLTQWADDKHGWLRKYYLRNTDEIHYDLTPAGQNAITWLMELKQNNFIGTESRLILVFELLNQITQQTEVDPALRIEELERQKEQIEEEIALAKRGEIKILEPTQVKERFLQAMSMSREIISDFRAVEQNFRELNKSIREKIVVWDKSKSELIEEYFIDKNAINNSDQGRSFNAFFEFLTSNKARENLDKSISYLRELEGFKDIVDKSGIEQIADEWLFGSEHVLRTIEVMSEQLRRYVDESYIEDERLISKTINSIEANSGLLLGEFPIGDFMEIDLPSTDINLLFDRPLFTQAKKIELKSDLVEYGEHDDDLEALYINYSVDKQLLMSNISELLEQKDKVNLGELSQKYPLRFGLSELMAYLDLGESTLNCKIDENQAQIITWKNNENKEMMAKMPLVEFFREE